VRASVSQVAAREVRAGQFCPAHAARRRAALARAPQESVHSRATVVHVSAGLGAALCSAQRTGERGAGSRNAPSRAAPDVRAVCGPCMRVSAAPTSVTGGNDDTEAARRRCNVQHLRAERRDGLRRVALAAANEARLQRVHSRVTRRTPHCRRHQSADGRLHAFSACVRRVGPADLGRRSLGIWPMRARRSGDLP